MTINYNTKDNFKEPGLTVLTVVKLNGLEVGSINEGTGVGDTWLPDTTKTVPIELRFPVSIEQCSDLKVEVSIKGTEQWDLTFSVNGTLSNNPNSPVRLLRITKTYKLGDNDSTDPAVESLSCPPVQ